MSAADLADARMGPLSHMRERVRVRAGSSRASQPAPSANALIPAFSGKREKGKGVQAKRDAGAGSNR